MKVIQTTILAVQLAEIHNMLKYFMMPPDVTVTPPLNVMTYDPDISCGGWMNYHSYAPNASVTINGNNRLEYILINFMQETKSRFQAQDDSIKKIDIQIGQIVITLSSKEYENPKLSEMSEEDTLEAETSQPIIVIQTVDSSNPDIENGKSYVTSSSTIETPSDVPEPEAFRFFFKKYHLHHPLKG